MGSGSRHAVLAPIDRLFRTGTAVGLSDAQLLERFVVDHDEIAESAFNVLVERHGPMVLAVCRRVLNDPHDAQDAFQATFLVLVRKASTVRKRESIADWLHGVARRVSARARADLARRRSIERRAATGSLIAYRPPLPDVDVRDEIEYLPHDLRAVVVLCYLAGLTHEQAARRLGWPVGTVRSRLARARARLRADLTRRGTAPDAALLPMLAFRKTSLPEGLIDATVRAAILLSARDAGEAGLVSARAVALTEGVLRTMLVSSSR
jgi:RNA polymerase sigma factor (sigma-70 family)